MKQEEFDRAIQYLRSELAKLRTGRANPSLVENIKVDYYGQEMTIKQLANISVPEARQILIQPWDRNALQPIETAITKSDLGLNPGNEGDKLRVVLPELDEERRKDLVKMVGKMEEEARVKVRNAREDLWKDIQKQEDAGEITEDDKFRKKEELDKTVEEYNKQIKEIAEKKEQEIMTV